MLYDYLIHWKARQGSVVATSIPEAEYIALSECAKDLRYFENVVRSIGLRVKRPMPLHGDSKTAIKMVEYTKSSPGSRQIDLEYHHIRDCNDQGIISVHHVAGALNESDIFTKALAKPEFMRNLKAMMTGGYNGKSR
jgi:hypothetical protein